MAVAGRAAFSVLVLVAVCSTACSSASTSGDPSTPDPSGSTGTTTAALVAPEGFRAVTVQITQADGTTTTRCLLVADDDRLRGRGLMGVTDDRLGGYDGMLFVFEADSEGAFFMKDTLIPLSIAFADSTGLVIGTDDMVPCPADTPTCPTTRPDGPFRYAVEVPSGGLDEVGLESGARLDPELGAACSRRGS